MSIVRRKISGYNFQVVKKSEDDNDVLSRDWIPNKTFGTSETVFTLYASQNEPIIGFIPFLALKRVLETLKGLCEVNSKCSKELVARPGVFELLLELFSIRQFQESARTVMSLLDILAFSAQPWEDEFYKRKRKEEQKKLDRRNALNRLAGRPKETMEGKVAADAWSSTEVYTGGITREGKVAVENDSIADSEEDGEFDYLKRGVEERFLQHLVDLLSLNICSEDIFVKTKNLIRLLCFIPGNRTTLHALMSHVASILGEQALRDLEFGSKIPIMVSQEVSTTDVKLLRILTILKFLKEEELSSPFTLGINLDKFCAVLVNSIKSAAKGKLDYQKKETKEADRISNINSPTIGILSRSPLHNVAFSMHSNFSQSFEPENATRKNQIHSLALNFAQSKLTMIKAFLLSCSLSPSKETDKLLVEFVQRFKFVLNSLIHQNPTLLEEDFQILLENHKCKVMLDFENKRLYFRNQIKKLKTGRPGTIRLHIRRAQVFDNAFSSLHKKSKQDMYGKLSISFAGEEGIDAGGVTREFYSILCRQMFQPDYALFKPSSDSTAFQPDPRSYIHEHHLEFFRFIGRIIAKAIFDNILVDAHFTRSFYKHILGLPIDYRDIQSMDPEYYKSLCDLLEMNLDELGLGLTFTTDTNEFGVVRTIELKPDGAKIPVTDENKMEFIQLCTKHKMTTGIQRQIDSFLAGFHELIPRKLISVFDEQELELLISGVPEVDIQDLKNNTEYVGYMKESAQVKWFWKTLESFSKEEHAKFLMFVTGTSKVPLEGFKNLVGMRGYQKFAIHKSVKNDKVLPSAHTCFNQLDLPEYSSEKILREKLYYAIHEGGEGFGFG